MATRMQQRRGTAEQWTTANPILAPGEIGFETDTREIKNMATRMQQRRGTAAQWTAANPVLAAGEIGYETDTEQFRIGDGTSSWSNLSPFKNIEDGGADFIELAQKGAAHGVATLNASAKIPLTQLPTELSLDLDLDAAIATEVTDRDAAIAYAAGILSTNLDNHAADSTGVHGIADTALLATKNYADNAVTDHNNDTTGVHGIEDTALLATKAYADGKASDAEDAAISAAATDATNKANAAQAAAISAAGTDAQSKADDAQAAAELTAAGDATTKANAAQVAAEATAAGALAVHSADTTDVHGIADTSALALMTDVTDAANDAATDATNKANAAQTAAETTAAGALSDHNSDSTNVHGISDTAALATKTYADNAVTAHDADTTNVHGIADTSALATKSYVDTADNLKAALASPSFSGTPTAPTAAAGTNTTQIATTEFVGTAVSELVASAPAALNTLNELAAALGSDANFSTTMTNALALKASKAELTAATLSSFNNKTTSYTPVIGDEGNVIEMDSSSSNTVTIPPASSVDFAIGSAIDIFQKGTGQTSIVAGAGVTVLNTPGLKLRARYSMATLIKRDTNTWIVSGDLTA